MSGDRLYISTNCFETPNLRAILSACEQHGIEGLELSAVEGWDPSLIGSTSHPARYLVHNYFPPADPAFVLNLASNDPSILERSRAHCRAALDLSARVGAPIYAVHGGYTADIAPEVLGHPERVAALQPDGFVDYETAYDILVESVRELSAYGRERGVHLLVENHVVSRAGGTAARRLLLMVEASELTALAGDAGDASVGVLVDVGHLKVSAATLGFDPHEFLDALAPLVGAFHLSDNDGVVDDHRPFDHHAWFLPRLEDFPEACITVELAPLPIEEVLAVSHTVARWQ